MANHRREVETGKLRRDRLFCPDSGKLIFRTRRKALKNNGKVGQWGGWSADAYVCRFCGWWHLTSRQS